MNFIFTSRGQKKKKINPKKLKETILLIKALLDER